MTNFCRNPRLDSVIAFATLASMVSVLVSSSVASAAIVGGAVERALSRAAQSRMSDYRRQFAPV